ncbi:hypothetical protein KY334_06825 [Candidatus Woesearchaeota archaeon]|nr:hypothetical protein [Candidatus Woesearchaeota archaeon]
MKKKTVKKAKCCDTKSDTCCETNFCKPNMNACGGGAYFLGIVGALVYYMSTATGFWSVIWGIIKALLWPAFLVFELLKFIH